MPNKPTEQFNAILLAAVSTNAQAEDDKFSLDAQIADGLAIAAKNGWKVIDVIRIEGHSRNYRTLAQLAAAARSHNEPGFDQLIAHFEACDFNILICRDANRFARKPSLLYEIVDTILEDCNARIYSLADGFVDSSNADMWLMVKGYEIRKQMKWIKEEMVKGRHKLIDDRGIPPGSSYVWSHMKVRDQKGKVLSFVPDPSKKAVIEQAARMVIDRVSWLHIETRLFEAGCGWNGQPFKIKFFYHLFNNPWFWGDAVRNHKNVLLANGQKIGLWVVDPSVPVPEGVVMHRAVNEPALTGDLALQLKAELIRRITFRPRRHDQVHKFSGLLICKRCGFYMVFSPHRTSDAYVCQSKYMARSRPGCDRKWSISERKVQRWVNAALEVMLASQDPYVLASAEPQSPADKLEQLNTTLAGLDKQIRRLIEKQAAAPDSLANLYDEQINGFAVQRENLLATIDTETRLAQRYNLVDVKAAYDELTTYQSLEAFWSAPSGIINQLLHRLTGGRRLAVLDHQIVGAVDI